MRPLAIIGAAFGFCFGAAVANAAVQTQQPLSSVPSPIISMPQGRPTATIVVISDKSGWTKDNAALATDLSGKGALVIGIDLPIYVKAIEAEARPCLYPMSAIERLSRLKQKQAGSTGYQAPIIVGTGAGASMALYLAAQTADATVSQTIAVNPDPAFTLSKPTCRAQAQAPLATAKKYGFDPARHLTERVRVVLADDKPVSSMPDLSAWKALNPEIEAGTAASTPQAFLQGELTQLISATETSEDELPIDVTDTPPKSDVMAVIISGDGGWRDIDSQVASFLQAKGIPSVGIDSLRYFWSERSAKETAALVDQLVDAYSRRFGTRYVALMGYSFGADIIPSTYLALQPRTRARIKLISLLGLSHEADYEVSVLGWTGAKGAGTAGDPSVDAKKIDTSLIQCVYGADEDDTGCPALAGTKAELLKLPGAHHYDGDYGKLTDHIVEALMKRLPRGEARD
jgi:type IV secretory pathway VirJ component